MNNASRVSAKEHMEGLLFGERGKPGVDRDRGENPSKYKIEPSRTYF